MMPTILSLVRLLPLQFHVTLTHLPFIRVLHSYYYFLSATMMMGKFSDKSSMAVKPSMTKTQGWLGCFLLHTPSSFSIFTASFFLLIYLDRKSCGHEEYWYCEIRLLVLCLRDCSKPHGMSCFEIVDTLTMLHVYDLYF